MLIKLLKAAYSKVSFDVITDPNEEHMPFEAQKAFVDRFPDPKDDYDRSYYKYLCWKAYFFSNKKLLMLLFNIGAMLVLPVAAIKLKNNYKRFTKENMQKYDAVLENVPRLPNKDVIPQEILDTYKRTVDIKEMNYIDGILGEKGCLICKELRKRFFFSFYYRLIVALKIAQFETYIIKYQPAALVFYSYEREFSGPLQSYLCELYDCKFISYMHGDLVYSMAFAFQKYSEHYIWGEEYYDLFDSLRCVFDIKTYTPKKLEGIATALPDDRCSYFATYYFSNETRECAEKIREIFDAFKEKGLLCKIRPHPRYSDIIMLKDVFQDYYIEEPKTYPLSESITQSLFIIGLNTTVLSQAYYSGKKVVIDDITKAGEYQELIKKKYVMLSRPHVKLTDLIRSEHIYDSSFKFYKCE